MFDRILTGLYFSFEFFGSFLKTDIFANLSNVGKMQTSLVLWKIWYIKLEKVRAFSLTIFVGMPFSYEALEKSKSFISPLWHPFL